MRITKYLGGGGTIISTHGHNLPDSLKMPFYGTRRNRSSSRIARWMLCTGWMLHRRGIIWVMVEIRPKSEMRSHPFHLFSASCLCTLEVLSSTPKSLGNPCLFVVDAVVFQYTFQHYSSACEGIPACGKDSKRRILKHGVNRIYIGQKCFMCESHETAVASTSLDGASRCHRSVKKPE